ncbi:hypothetical protein BDEG_26517 [Batrachochytrium dendrobatidis JEL423]|uniref:Phosphoglycerate dehydrogenase n=1 Tax=Batrachochytrium dendrobatidis (strain JEL423) TaxID=403673 RepID=A0A177WTJ3_BATDL|nr:hypothetical protein BDEG_26517 [Batrachochytrium dendrobatidis JEL423]
MILFLLILNSGDEFDSGERETEYLTDEVLRSAHRLLAIGVFGPLSIQVNLKAAQAMGIPVFTAPYQYTHSVAEMSLANIILLSRQIGDRSKEIHAGEWNKANLTDLRGKTLGIVGYGHAGSQLGIMAEALSICVIFYDELSLMPIGRAKPVDTLDELLAKSDYVAINITSTPENDGLFDKNMLAKMKQGSYLINASASEAVDHAALADAIKSKHIAAGDTLEARRRIVAEITEDVVRYISEGTTIGAVNFPSVAAWPLKPGSRRIICMHRNVRGVLKEIDHILSAYNVGKQVLDTKDSLGYLIADVMTDQLSTEIVSQLAMLANTVRTRIV